MNYLLLALGWALYFLSHSLLASRIPKNWVKQHFASLYPYYRLCYNLFAGSGLLALVYWQSRLPVVLVFEPQSFHWILSGGLGLVGIFVMLRAFQNYSLAEFTGLEQIRNGQLQASPILKKEGLNALVRHPLYFGAILFLIAYFLASPSSKNLIFISIIFIYLYLGTLSEEKKLVLVFGEAYKVYQKEVKMLIPYLL